MNSLQGPSQQREISRQIQLPIMIYLFPMGEKRERRPYHSTQMIAIAATTRLFLDFLLLGDI